MSVRKVIQSVEILMAEDDPEDQMLVRTAFEEAHLANKLRIVSNGEELMDYLNARGEYQEMPTPDLLLVDLNMPRKDGREAIREIKTDPALQHIPIIVLTTSAAEEDILASYRLGVSTYIRKPVTFEKLLDVVKTFSKYWFEIAELPNVEKAP